MLHEADPARLRMAQERMLHPAVKLDGDMTRAVVDAIGMCVCKSDPPLIVAAGAVDFTHFHLALEYNPRDIEATCKWIADQATKAVHRNTTHQGPVWGKGKWLEFTYDEGHWRSLIRYIERHNERNGLNARPYDWIRGVRA
jgi:hypothetical protein